MVMKRLLIFLTFTALIAVVVACKKGAWCPVEVNVPIVSADIPDTVDVGQKFTADFVLDKGECIKEYRVRSYLQKDTVWFFGEAIQDFCDEFPDTASVEQSVGLSLGDYNRYLVIYVAIDTTSQSLNYMQKYIAIRK